MPDSRVFIAGYDGYLGWPLTQHLLQRGHIVAGLDALLRREHVTEIGGYSALPVSSPEGRLAALEQHCGFRPDLRIGNMLDYVTLREFLEDFEPDVIVHLAEIPSAAWSMIDQAHSSFTQHNNVIGTLNLLWAMHEVCQDAHLVKLGTMGEYGTPAMDIPEGFFEPEFRGRRERLPFPRQAGSFYHWSKVHDSNNTMFACGLWGLRATDIMQGVVYGTCHDEQSIDQRLRTRLDFDQCFGTVVNRFCCQAVVGHPLTPYGQGGQKRAYLPLRDVMQCLTLVIDNPPQPGEYRVFNQFDECYTVNELAGIVQDVAGAAGLVVDIMPIENPREENEAHQYRPDREHLSTLGYCPSGSPEQEIGLMLQDLLPQRERIAAKMDLLLPDIRWDGAHRRSAALAGDATR